MDEEAIVRDWVRHYARLVLAFVMLGALVAGAYLRFGPKEHEAWTILIQTNDRIPLAHLDSVAAAVFQSQAVFQPALRALGVRESPTTFIENHADLHSVPDSNTLIVVGRASTLTEAKRISSAMARSLVQAFASRSGAKFNVFGKSQASPVPAQLGTDTGVALGAVIGLWLGLATCLVLYRSGRPVLNVAAAENLLEPEHTTLVRKGSSWTRPFRRRSAHREDAVDERRLAQLRDRVERSARGDVRLVLEVGRRARRSPIVERLASVAGPPAVGETSEDERSLWLVACDASARTQDLRKIRSGILDRNGHDRPRLELVWVR